METTLANEYGNKKLRRPHDMKKTLKIKAASELRIEEREIQKMKTTSKNEDNLEK